MANSPAPNLQIHPTSGLSFPWAEYHPDPVAGSGTHAFGSDGVSVGMKILIFWEDLPTALVELLGYSWRDSSKLTSLGTPFLRREIPWNHPIFEHLFVKRIAEVRGIRQQGMSLIPFLVDSNTPSGPHTDFYLAELTLHFWRPPYYIRTDNEVVDPNIPEGDHREWTRYVSKQWEMSLNMLSRENSTFNWLPGVKPPSSSKYFPGSVGQTITHFRVSRTWFQIPEQALFATIAGGTPDGLPRNMVLTQTPTENPLSLFNNALGTTQTTTNTTTGTTTTVTTYTTVGTTTPNASQLLAGAGYTYAAGMPFGGCVNAPIGGGRAVDAMGNWVDLTTASRFFGCRTGTLRFDGVTFEPQALQLPPDLMKIPRLSKIEALSQVQYNVTFHFDLFEPPPGSEYGTPICGHNLFPYAGNGLWYPIISQKNASDGTTGPFLTPFHYADFTDLFYIL